jgi:hypothetical protein
MKALPLDMANIPEDLNLEDFEVYSLIYKMCGKDYLTNHWRLYLKVLPLLDILYSALLHGMCCISLSDFC